MFKKQSILVTGSDLVGKTTLISSLSDRFGEGGKTLIRNKFDLHKTSIYSSASSLMNENWKNNKLEINSFLAMAFLIDGLNYTQPEGSILLQDSYVFRTMAFCKAYDVPYIPELLENLRTKLFSFDITLLLTTSLDVKKERLGYGGSMFHRDLLSNEKRASKMDLALEEYVQLCPNYYKIDTSNMSKELVLEESLNHIMGVLERCL